LLVTFPDNRSFGMDLSTRASRLLHKCHGNDTICVLKLWLLFSINDSVTTGVSLVNIRLLPSSTSAFYVTVS